MNTSNHSRGFFKTPGFFAGQPYNPAAYGEDVWAGDNWHGVVARPSRRRAPANTRVSLHDRAFDAFRRHIGLILVLGIAIGTVAHMLVPLWTPGFLVGVTVAAVWRAVKR